MNKGKILFWSGLLLWVVTNTHSLVTHLYKDSEISPIGWLLRYLLAVAFWIIIYKWNPAWLRNIVGYTFGILGIAFLVCISFGATNWEWWNLAQVAILVYITFILLGSHEVKEYLKRNAQPGNPADS